MAEQKVPVDSKLLEKQYLQELDNSIISYLSVSRHISTQEAMDKYYNSKLCEYIHQGKYDIQYLDHKLLVEEYL